MWRLVGVPTLHWRVSGERSVNDAFLLRRGVDDPGMNVALCRLSNVKSIRSENGCKTVMLLLAMLVETLGKRLGVFVKIYFFIQNHRAEMKCYSMLTLLVLLFTTAEAAPIPLARCPLITPASPPFGRNLRSLYQYDPSYLNLNHGSYGSVPRSVTLTRRCWSDHVESSPDQWYRYDMFDTIDQVRQKLSKYIHSASPDDVVFVDNASHGMNAVLRSLVPTLLAGKNTKILYLQTAYRMVLNTLDFLHDVYHDQLLQVNITTNVPSSSTFEDAVVEAVDRALAAEESGTVVLASFSHIVSLPGAILPIKRLVAVCHKYGVQVLVDGAHALGHIPINVQDLNPDYYVTNGHKWLYSSKGSALLWVNPIRQKNIAPTTISYEGQGDTRFQIGFSYQGTQDMTQFMSMYAALEFRAILTTNNDTKIYDYMHQLAVAGGHILAAAWGTELLLPNNSFGAMVDVRLPSNASYDVLQHLPATLLAKYNTWVPAYGWDGEKFDNSSSKWYVRVSAQIYNDESDFKFLANAVNEIIAGEKKV